MRRMSWEEGGNPREPCRGRSCGVTSGSGEMYWPTGPAGEGRILPKERLLHHVSNTVEGRVGRGGADGTSAEGLINGHLSC
jgi:hypothetical protein